MTVKACGASAAAESLQAMDIIRPRLAPMNGIVADTELNRADEINYADERMPKGEVKYRFVIDNESLAT